MSPSVRATGATALGPGAPQSHAPRLGAARSRRRLPGSRTLLAIAAAGSGTGLLLAACSSSTPAHTGKAFGLSRGPIAAAPAAGGVGGVNGPAQGGPSHLSLAAQAQLTKLPPSQSLIYTANLTLRVKNVTTTATAVTTLVTGVGGYVSSQQETLMPGSHGTAQINLTLKIPVALYHSTLIRLGTFGTQLFLNSQAVNVTQQVADVTSRVASAQAAIRQLRALLAKAGNVSSLLAVQNEINSQESALESLLAQQQALAHETSYGTVSVQLVGRHVAIVKKPKQKSHGFIAGLGAGWRALVAAVTWLLTALGVVLPFAAIVAVLVGIAIGSRRRRRRTPPAADPPAATTS